MLGPPRPPQPSRGHEPTRIWHDETTSESARQNRTDAGYIAVDLLGGCSGTPAGIAARLIELAEPIADWIRDGTRPEPEVYHSIHGDPRPPMTTEQFEEYLNTLDGTRQPRAVVCYCTEHELTTQRWRADCPQHGTKAGAS